MAYPNLKAELARQGKTQKQMAELLGKQAPRISCWMNGKGEPRVSDALKIADWLDERIEYLFAE